MKVGSLVMVMALPVNGEVLEWTSPEFELERNTPYIVRDVDPSGWVKVARDRDGHMLSNRYSPDCFRVVGMKGATRVATAARKEGVIMLKPGSRVTPRAVITRTFFRDHYRDDVNYPWLLPGTTFVVTRIRGDIVSVAEESTGRSVVAVHDLCPAEFASEFFVEVEDAGGRAAA